MKKFIVFIWLGVVLAGIATLFWHNEWVYSLPTPVPANYQAVDAGKKIDLSSKLELDHTKPVFLHFFNPACPCSRFNMTHFKSLVKEYDHEASFAIVVMSSSEHTAKEIQSKFNIGLPVLFDSTIATDCGVYSTPQAVIIDTNHQLVYRGNYNRARYCTDKKTAYAKIALDSLLRGKTAVFDRYALIAYGCQLPKCSK